MNTEDVYNSPGADFSDHEVKIINNIRLICSGISTVSCLIMITFYFLMCLKYRCKRHSKNQNTNSLIDDEEEYNTDTKINTSESLVIQDTSLGRLMNQMKRVKTSSSTFRKQEKKMGLGIDLIFFLIVSNLGWSVCSFLGMEGFKMKDSLCIAQAFTQNFFDMSGVCWNSIISRVTLLGTRRNCSDMKKIKKRLYAFFIYSNLLPLLVTLGPLLTDDYGPSGVWCWINMIDSTTSASMWIVVTYIFTWTHVVYAIYALITTSRYFSRRKHEIGNDQNKTKEAKFLKKYVLFLRLFPLTLVFTRLASTLNRTYAFFYNENNPYLFGLQAILFSLSGFFNSLFYSYFYRSVFKTCCVKEEDSDV